MKRCTTRWTFGLVVAGLCATALPLSAQAGPLPHKHDGLLIRLSPGFSGAAAATEAKAGDMSIAGPAGYFGFAIGGAITQNLVLSFTGSSNVVVGPELKVDDVTVDADEDVSWGMHFGGIGADYYIMPLNLYLSGAVGALVMTLDTPGEMEESEVGFGTILGVGKEWWVSDNWGIGISANATIGAVPDGDDTWGAAAFAMALSATYN